MAQTASSTVDQAVVDLARQILQTHLNTFGLRAVNVRAGEDHDGEPVLYVEADYDLSEVAVDTAVTAAVTTKLRDALWAVGERRFPHIRHRLAEGQIVQTRRRAGA
jgi:hypothetical protein